MIVGHRGGRGPGWPAENTLVAFERARREGADAIETDVRLCASGEVVAFHDPDLARMTGGTDRRPLATVSLAELGQVSLGGDARIPTLAALVDWADGCGAGLDIEIKHDVPSRAPLVRAVARALAACRVPLIVSSFDPLSLAGMAVLAPRVPRALLTDPKQSYAAALHAGAGVAARVRGLSALYVERRQAVAPAVARWRRQGLEVGVWTVNDGEEASLLARSGVGVLITDMPGALAAALGRA